MKTSVSQTDATKGNATAQPVKTEKQMREEKAPTPKTQQELLDYIESLAVMQHDYGTCVYAMSLAATAAFNYMASKLGVSGFQAGAAGMDVIRRTRSMDGPFMIVDISDELYEAGRTVAKVNEYVLESRVWLRGEARKKIAVGGYFHPDVFHRMATLATFAPSITKDVEAWNALNPNDPITGQDWYDRNRFDLDFFAEKLAFLRKMGGYFPSEEFTEAHIDDFKRFGFKDVSLLEGDVSKYDSVEDGCSFRLEMPTSLRFSRTVDGIVISYSIETEISGSNGSSKLNFDFPLLEHLVEIAMPSVASFINGYILRARTAAQKTV